LTKRSIYVASIKELAGKSIVTISLALKAKEMGEKVGYFKPVGICSSLSGEGEVVDEDVETIKEILELEEEYELICPITLGKSEFLEEFSKAKTKEYTRKIFEAYEKVSEDKDIMLIEGPDTLSTGAFLNLSVPRLARALSSKVLLVAQVKDDSVVDELIQARDYCTKWGVTPFGAILNRVPTEKMARTEYVVKKHLEGQNLKVLGVIPEEKTLSALTVREVYDAVGGEILAGKEGMDKTIQTFLIGAMTMESATKYFRKATNKLVITGGDRTDVIFAALETGTSALILTGNLHPSVKILPRADDLAVPIILVPYDTFTTLQLVQKIIGKIKPKDKKRIDIAKRLFEENMEWKKILNSMNRTSII